MPFALMSTHVATLLYANASAMKHVPSSPRFLPLASTVCTRRSSSMTSRSMRLASRVMIFFCCCCCFGATDTGPSIPSSPTPLATGTSSLVAPMDGIPPSNAPRSPGDDAFPPPPFNFVHAKYPTTASAAPAAPTTVISTSIAVPAPPLRSATVAFFFFAPDRFFFPPADFVFFPLALAPLAALGASAFASAGADVSRPISPSPVASVAVAPSPTSASPDDASASRATSVVALASPLAFVVPEVSAPSLPSPFAPFAPAVARAAAHRRAMARPTGRARARASSDARDATRRAHFAEENLAVDGDVAIATRPRVRASARVDDRARGGLALRARAIRARFERRRRRAARR